MANKKEIQIITKLSRTQFTQEEIEFLENYLAQSFRYFSDLDKSYSVGINRKLGLMKDFSNGI